MAVDLLLEAYAATTKARQEQTQDEDEEKPDGQATKQVEQEEMEEQEQQDLFDALHTTVILGKTFCLCIKVLVLCLNFCFTSMLSANKLTASPKHKSI